MKSVEYCLRCVTTSSQARPWNLLLWTTISVTLSMPVLAARIDCYRLRDPGNKHDIEQASDLYYGRLSTREGLWLVCDRNGGLSAGRIYRISSARLKTAKPHDAIVADEEFAIELPQGDWSAFVRAHEGAGRDVLEDVRRRILSDPRSLDNDKLDLEAITVGPSPLPPHERHVFVVAEEPYSVVLELELEGQAQPGRARWVAAYRYFEREDEHGTDWNDALEGLAYAGKPGMFYWVEEGTKLHAPDAHPRLFFDQPRLGLGELKSGKVVVEPEVSEPLTHAVWSQKSGKQQTLNALAVLPNGQLLAVDRNGGWILRINPQSRTVTRWLNLYDLEGVNLRQFLAEFPGPRQMPYISIEGLALDDSGAIWLCDDPAMPEAFHESCLVRISDLENRDKLQPPVTTTRSAGH